MLGIGSIARADLELRKDEPLSEFDKALMQSSALPSSAILGEREAQTDAFVATADLGA
jgi:hypothetical protein